jgi:hypothetical protein
VFELTGTDHLLAPTLPADVIGALLLEGWSPIEIPGANGG